VAGIVASGYPSAADVVKYLTPDLEPPERISAMIEALT
jgi:hypothetical protein